MVKSIHGAGEYLRGMRSVGIALHPRRMSQQRDDQLTIYQSLLRSASLPSWAPPAQTLCRGLGHTGFRSSRKSGVAAHHASHAALRQTSRIVGYADNGDVLSKSVIRCYPNDEKVERFHTIFELPTSYPQSPVTTCLAYRPENRVATHRFLTTSETLSASASSDSLITASSASQLADRELSRSPPPGRPTGRACHAGAEA